MLTGKRNPGKLNPVLRRLVLIEDRGWERDGKKEEMGTGSENEMPKYFSEYTYTLLCSW